MCLLTKETLKCVCILPIVPSQPGEWTGKLLSVEGENQTLHFPVWIVNIFYLSYWMLNIECFCVIFVLWEPQLLYGSYHDCTGMQEVWENIFSVNILVSKHSSTHWGNHSGNQIPNSSQNMLLQVLVKTYWDNMMVFIISRFHCCVFLFVMKLINTNTKSWEKIRVNWAEQSTTSSPSNPRCNSQFMRCNAVTSCKQMFGKLISETIDADNIVLCSLKCWLLYGHTSIWPGLLETTDLDVDITDPTSDRWNPLIRLLWTITLDIWDLLILASSMGCGTQQLQETPISLRNSSR